MKNKRAFLEKSLDIVIIFKYFLSVLSSYDTK